MHYAYHLDIVMLPPQTRDTSTMTRTFHTPVSCVEGHGHVGPAFIIIVR
jgi:hypothetical protein